MTEMKSDVVFDLESTCWNDGPKRQMETIEIGAVKIGAVKIDGDEIVAEIERKQAGEA